MKPLPRKEDIVRITCVDLPDKKVKYSGWYEYRYMADKVMMDILDIEKQIEELLPGRGDEILNRLQNFRRVYINTATGEVST